MIIDRYIIREILKPAATICAVLVAIFGCYISTRYGEDAVQGLLPGSSVLKLILLRIVIALEVLLPTTLYFSVIIALSRLYRDAEMVAMFACGIRMARVIRAVFLVSIMGGVIVACLSLYIRPWAWNQFFQVKAEAEANFDLTRMKAGNFYKTQNRVIFADEVNQQQHLAKRVFIQTKRPNSLQIIYANQAGQHRDQDLNRLVLTFQDGNLYEFSSLDDKGIVLEFENSAMPLQPRDIIEQKYRVKAASTRALFHSQNLEEAAELQWRLASPISIVLLALLGIPLSHSTPRQGRFITLPIAVAVFAVYYNFSAFTKKWVAQGILDTFPGIWWGQLLLALLFATLFWYPSLPFFRRK